MWWFVALQGDRVGHGASDGAGDGDRAVWILVLVCIVGFKFLQIEGLDNDKDAKSHDSDKRVLLG